MCDCKKCFFHYYNNNGEVRCNISISNQSEDCNFFNPMETISSDININNKVKYIVHLKNDFKMPNTTINREFCGSPIKWIEDRVVFDLNSVYDAQVIIPIDVIDWMAPSKIWWENER